MELFHRQWETRQYLAAMNTLALLYGLTTEDSARASLESLALSRAEALPAAERARMLEGNPATHIFPWSLVAWAHAKAQVVDDPKRFEAVRPTLEGILTRGGLATTRILADQFLALNQRSGRATVRDITFFLPQNGPQAAIARRILLGAQIAGDELKNAGVHFQVRSLDAGSPGALSELSALPPGSIVAGPLRKEDWERITAAGIHKTLAFLSFLPTLPGEGRDGWRLLASPEDQVRVLATAMASFGATTAAILYPQDRFGMAMAPLFTQALEAKGFQVTATSSYDPAQPAAWGAVVAELLGAKGKDAPSSLPPFEAVFLPDSLLKAQHIVAFLRYYDAGHLLVLGPQLWSQTVDSPELEIPSFRLAVFPGALLPSRPEAQRLAAAATAASAKLDGWIALGYDTVRLVLLLPPYTGDPEAFSGALADASAGMAWTLAPIRWDASGRASQELFPLQITANGLTLADWEALRQARDRSLTQRNNPKKK